MKYQFKTNINCGGCVASVTPHLNANKEIKQWEVDTKNPNKILTIDTDALSADTLTKIVHDAGFNAVPLGNS